MDRVARAEHPWLAPHIFQQLDRRTPRTTGGGRQLHVERLLAAERERVRWHHECAAGTEHFPQGLHHELGSVLGELASSRRTQAVETRLHEHRIAGPKSDGAE